VKGFIFSSHLTRLCAWLLLDALARKRSMTAWMRLRFGFLLRAHRRIEARFCSRCSTNRSYVPL
jgi:hypothetical protein